jgi:hypothetical protein
MEDREMKKIIIGIMLGIILTSLGGCFIPYREDGRRHPGHDRGRDDGHERRDRDDRDEHRR